jgi:hypothetical protein
VTIPLPYSVPTASQWQLVDWVEPIFDSSAATGGLATITVDQLASDQMWLIDRAVVSCTSAAKTAARLYVNGVVARGLRSGSTVGNFDEAEYPSGLLVRPGSQLIARWTGCTDGAIATLALQARLFRRA